MTTTVGHRRNWFFLGALCLLGSFLATAAASAVPLPRELLNLRIIDLSGADLPSLEIRIEGYPPFWTNLGGKTTVLLASEARNGDRLKVSLGPQPSDPRQAWTLVWPKDGNLFLPEPKADGVRTVAMVLQTMADRDEMAKLVQEYTVSSWRGNRPGALTHEFHHDALVSLVQDLAERRGEGAEARVISEVYRELQQGDFRAAKAYYSRLFAGRDSESSKVRQDAAIAARHLGTMVLAREPEQAIYYFQWAVYLDPDESSSWNLLGFMLRRQRRFVAAEEAYQKLLELATTQLNPDIKRLAFEGLGEVFIDGEDYETARKYLLGALQLNQDLGYERRTAFQYRRLGFIHQFWGDFERAREYFGESMAIGEKVQNPGGIAADRCSLALIDREQGRYFKAEKALETYLKRSENVNFRAGEIRGLGALGEIYLRTGRRSEAENRLRKALDLSQDFGFPLLAAKINVLLARLHQEQGEFDLAEKNLNQALEVGEDLGSELTLALVYQGFGKFYQTQRASDFAEEAYSKALDIDQRHGRKPGLAYNHLGLGLVDRARGDLDRAESRFHQANVLFGAMDNARGQGISYLMLGAVNEEKTQSGLAANHLNKAVKIYRELGQKRNEAKALDLLRKSYVRLGRREDIRRCLLRSLDLYQELGDEQHIRRTKFWLAQEDYRRRKTR